MSHMSVLRCTQSVAASVWPPRLLGDGPSDSARRNAELCREGLHHASRSACRIVTTADLINGGPRQSCHRRTLAGQFRSIAPPVSTVVLRPGTPRQVYETVVTSATGAMKTVISLWARSDERLQHKHVDVLSRTAPELDLNVTATVRDRQQHASAMVPFGSAAATATDNDQPVQAPHAPEVANFVGALKAHHRKPALDRPRFRKGQFRRNVTHVSLLSRLAVPRPVSAGAGLSNALPILPQRTLEAS